MKRLRKALILMLTIVIALSGITIYPSKTQAAVAYKWIKYTAKNGYAYSDVRTNIINTDYITGYRSFTFDPNSGTFDLGGSEGQFNSGVAYTYDFAPGNRSKIHYVRMYSDNMAEKGYYEAVTKKIAGDRIGAVYSSQSDAYPSNAVDFDGYFYIYEGTVTSKPSVVEITDPSDKTYYKDQDTFSISGTLTDELSETVLVSGTIAGVTKFAEVRNSTSKSSWTLTWQLSEMPVGSFKPSIIVDNGMEASAANYQGTINIKDQVYYYWNKYNSISDPTWYTVTLGSGQGYRQLVRSGVKETPGSAYYSILNDNSRFYDSINLTNGNFSLGGAETTYYNTTSDWTGYKLGSDGNYYMIVHQYRSNDTSLALYKLSSTQPKAKGNFIQANIKAAQGTYPDDGIHSDGLWYTNVGTVPNNQPTMVMTSSGNQSVTLKPGNDTITISGVATDRDNDILLVEATFGGVTKSVSVSDTAQGKAWSLSWRTSEFTSSGATNSVRATVTDGKSPVMMYVYSANISWNTTPLYYWDKYSTKNQVTSYREAKGTTFRSNIDNIGGYRNYTFNSSNGEFYGVGNFETAPTYPTWAGTRLYAMGYKSMTEYLVTNLEQTQVTPYSSVANSTVKVKDALVESNILDLDKKYPDNGVHSDGFWYIKKANTNMAPVLTVDNSDQLIGSKSTKIILKGTASDADGDKVTVSATLNGVTKSANITGSGSWQLEWSVNEVKEATYSNVEITGEDGKQGVDKIVYNGRIIFDMIAPQKPEVTLSTDTWTNQYVMLFSRHGSDVGSGSDYTEYTSDGTTWHKYTAPVTISKSGESKYQLRTIDRAGNVGEVAEIIVRVDKVPPTKPKLLLSEDKYTQDPVTITLTDGEDELSGVDRSEIKVGTGNWETVTDIIEVDEEGETEVRARTVDIAGNISDEESVTVLIDRTAPTPPNYSLSDSQWTKEDVTFELNGSQDASEITYEYKIDDGSYTEGDKGTVTESGEHTITARAVDAVGLVSSEIQFKVRIDKDLPEVDFAPNGQQWAVQGTDIEIKATDALSGVVEPVYYEITQNEQPSGSWQVVRDGKVKVEDTEGTWYVHTQVMDKAGNVGTQSSKPYQVQQAPDAATTATVEATAISASEVRLKWDLPEGNRYAEGYTYTIKNMNTGAEKTVEYPIHEYVDQQLQGGQTYNYQLTVRNHVGSVESQTAALTFPDSPGVEVSPIFRTPSEMSINIDQVPSATEYRLKLMDHQGNVHENEVMSGTQKTLIGLEAGKNYTVQVSAINSSGESEATSVGFLTLPETPTGFTSIEIKEDSISTEWQSVTTATYYELYRADELIYNGVDQKYKDVGLSAGTVYEYLVAAQNETGEGELSDPLNVMTLPQQDNSLHMLNYSTTGFTAQWDGVQSANMYRLEVYDMDQNQVANYQGSNLNYDVTGLEPGKEYRVSLVAYNQSGAGQEKIVNTMTLPSQVDTVDVTGIGETEVGFIISTVTGASSYKIELNGKEYLSNDPNYVLSALEGSTAYNGTVQAGNSSGWSAPTSFSFLTKPVRPNSLQVDTASETEIMLGWKEDSTAERYWITDEQGAVTEANEAKITITELQPGTEYRFKVATENASGMGLESEIVWSTRTEAPEIDQLDVQDQDASLSWTEPFGSLKFMIIDEASGKEYYSGADSAAHLADLESGQVYELTLYALNKMDAKSKGTRVKLVTRATLTQSNVKFTDVSSNSVTIEIEKAGQEIQKYAILRAGVEIAQVGAGNQVSFIDKELEPGKEYAYEILPINQSGEGKGIKLSTMTATLPVADPEVVSGDDWVEIKFPAVPKATEYVIVDQNGTELWRGNTMPVRLDNLEPGKEYALEIIAENTLGHSSSPVPVSVWTLPEAPTGIESTSTETSITINFSDGSSEGLTEYVIYKSGKVVGRIKAGEKSWTDKNLAANTNYRYEIKAVNRGGESTKGTIVEQMTKQEQVFDPVVPSSPASTSPTIDTDVPKNEQSDDKTNDQATNTNVSIPVSGVFKDVSDLNFAKSEIETLASEGVIKGLSTNVFAPNKEITRMEFAALIVRVLNAKPDETIAMTFNDVKDSAWYVEELNAAVANGIAKGFSSHEFRPNTTVNREQAAKMLVNVLVSKGLTPQKSDHKFMDDSDIATWAADDVKMATDQKFVQGYPDNTFRPKKGLTRAEAAVMIYRLRDQLNNSVSN